MKPRAQSFKDCLPFHSSISFHPYFSSIPLSCASFGKLISSGRRWKFCTKLAKLFNPPQAPQRRLPSHLYAFTVFDLFAQNLNGKTAVAPGPAPQKWKGGASCLPWKCGFVAYLLTFPLFFGSQRPTPDSIVISGCGTRGHCLPNLIDCLISLIDSHSRTNFELIKLKCCSVTQWLPFLCHFEGLIARLSWPTKKVYW